MPHVFPRHIHCIGIKGSGLAALAILLKQSKYCISGSDVSDVFYTDSMLQNAGIAWNTGFNPKNIPPKTELVIYSAAYNFENNAELAYAKNKSVSCLSYPEALGMFSRTRESWAVIGTHGKTTTTAFIGLLCKSQNMDASVLTGSALPDFGNSAVLHQGDKVFFAEVCEYKNHFAHFSPHAAVFTSAEWDHPDYFSSVDEVFKHFASFLKRLPKNAPLIACIDDAGVQDTLRRTKQGVSNAAHTYFYTSTPQIPKAFEEMAKHIIHIEEQGIVMHERGKVQSFRIHGLDTEADRLVWYLPMPSLALVYNATAALISLATYMKNRGIAIDWQAMQKTLAHCRGISRRSEVLHHDAHYTIVDDYAHHPTAIEKTLQGITAFYQPKRLRVNFMPHTYSRTEKLWSDFLTCFTSADEVIVNDVYASAREEHAKNTNKDAEHLAQDIASRNATMRVQYIPTIEQTIEYVAGSLESGDLFLSMGAGDNFRASHAIAQKIQDGSLA